MKKKSFLTVSILVILIVIIIYSVFLNKETFNTSKASKEHYELKKTINYIDYDEAPYKIGYVEEKDGKVYEGTLEKKSFTQDKPGNAKIEYVGEVYEADDQNAEPGISWIEMSIYQKIDDISNPPTEKDVVVEFQGRLYKGTLDLELDKEIITDLDGQSASYYGILYYDNTL